jgi:CheY-like chemotaxis protein
MAKRILIIDDEELIIKSLSRLLEKNGYEVFIAKNGRDALIITEDEQFDLIIADIRMPGMNGVETVNSIYKNLQTRKSQRVPTIFITGFADETMHQKAKELMPVAYIYKPFDISDFIERIKRVIG